MATVNTRRTITTTQRVTPESIKVVEEKKENPKTLKIKMCALYISDVYILEDGKEYELPFNLANILIKNKEAIKC